MVRKADSDEFQLVPDTLCVTVKEFGGEAFGGRE